MPTVLVRSFLCLRRIVAESGYAHGRNEGRVRCTLGFNGGWWRIGSDCESKIVARCWEMDASYRGGRWSLNQ